MGAWLTEKCTFIPTKHRVLFFSKGGAVIYLEQGAALRHMAPGYFGAQPGRTRL